jgi:hypothetical protein
MVLMHFGPHPLGAQLTIWRKGEEKSISLTLDELPKDRQARAAAGDGGAWRSSSPGWPGRRLEAHLPPSSHLAEK